jgi:hypothetical protein
MLHLSHRTQCGARCAGDSSTRYSRPQRLLLACPPGAKRHAGDGGGEQQEQEHDTSTPAPPPADADNNTNGPPLIRSTRAPRRKTPSASTPTSNRGSAASRIKRAAQEEAARFAAAAASSDPAIAALRSKLVKRTPAALVRSQGLPAATLDVGVLGAGEERYYAISVAEGKEERYASWLLKRARSGQAPGGVPAPPAPTISEVWAPQRSALVYVPSSDSLSKTPKQVPYGGGGWVFVKCRMDAAAAAAIAQTPHFAAWRGAQRWDSELLRAAGALDYYASAADEKAGKLSPPPADLRVDEAGGEAGAVVLPVPSSDALVAAVRAWEAEADPARGGRVLAEAVDARRREVYGDAGGTIFGVGQAEADAQREVQRAAGRGGRGGRGGGRGDGAAAGRGRGRGRGQQERWQQQDDGGGARWSESEEAASLRTAPGDRRRDARRTFGNDGARFDPYSLDRDMSSDRYADDAVGGGDYDSTPRYRDRRASTFGGGGGGGGEDGSDDDVIGDALYMGDELLASDSRVGRYADDDDRGSTRRRSAARDEANAPPRSQRSLPTPPGDRGAGARRALGDGARFDPYSLDRDMASDRYSSGDDDDDAGPPRQQQRQQRQGQQRQEQQRQEQQPQPPRQRGSDPLGDTLFGGRAHAEDGGRYFDIDDDFGGGGGGAWYDGGEDPAPLGQGRHAGAWFAEGTRDEEAEEGDDRAAAGGVARRSGGGGGGKSKVVPGSDAIGDALFGLDYVDGGYRGVDLED